MFTDIVQIDVPYSYKKMVEDLKILKYRYSFLQIEEIGQSVLGRNLYAIRLGIGDKEVFYSGNWHANEYLTGHLLMKFIEDYSIAISNGLPLFEYDIFRLYHDYSIWIVPMVNPDGVDMLLEGIQMNNHCVEKAIEINDGSTDFRNWTANIRGVDLNHQWPAEWEVEVERSPKVPSPKRYGGVAPLTEPETIAIYDFVKNHDFQMVLAFHSQGEEIFWGFNNLEPPYSEVVAKRFAELTGYESKQSASSSAGFKDWFIQDYRKMGFTIEIGLGKNPLPISQFLTIYQLNTPLLIEGPYFT